MVMKLSINFYRKNTTTVWRLEWGPPLSGFDPRPCQSWHQLSRQQGPQHHECVCCRGATRECCWKGWQNSSWRWTAGGTDFHYMRNKCSVRFILCISLVLMYGWDKIRKSWNFGALCKFLWSSWHWHFISIHSKQIRKGILYQYHLKRLICDIKMIELLKEFSKYLYFFLLDSSPFEIYN